MRKVSYVFRTTRYLRDNVGKNKTLRFTFYLRKEKSRQVNMSELRFFLLRRQTTVKVIFGKKMNKINVWLIKWKGEHVVLYDRALGNCTSEHTGLTG